MFCPRVMAGEWLLSSDRLHHVGSIVPPANPQCHEIKNKQASKQTIKKLCQRLSKRHHLWLGKYIGGRLLEAGRIRDMRHQLFHFSWSICCCSLQGTMSWSKLSFWSSLEHLFLCSSVTSLWYTASIFMFKCNYFIKTSFCLQWSQNCHLLFQAFPVTQHRKFSVSI